MVFVIQRINSYIFVSLIGGTGRSLKSSHGDCMYCRDAVPVASQGDLSAAAIPILFVWGERPNKRPIQGGILDDVVLLSEVGSVQHTKPLEGFSIPMPAKFCHKDFFI